MTISTFQFFLIRLKKKNICFILICFSLFYQSKVDGRYLAPLTIEKVTAEDLDVDDNHILMVENSNGRSEFLITIRSDLFSKLSSNNLYL